MVNSKMTAEPTPKMPFLTAELGAVKGVIKQRPQDFIVEEIPLYQPSGEGTHIYALIEKTQLTTHDAIARLAAAMGVRRVDVGYAGRKDAQAVARQWISIEHIDPDKLAALDKPQLKVLKIARHGNKLKVGHLTGNKFFVRMRNLSMPAKQAEKAAQTIMDVLMRRGVPNYFGPQRFGGRGNSGELGWALIDNNAQEFCRLFLGDPANETDKRFIEARILCERGEYQQALDCWPKSFHDHRRMLTGLVKSNGNFKRATRDLDDSFKGLLVSAWQSEIFNEVLAARMPNIDKVLVGDMAMKHDNGACFHVENAETEQPRCEHFEISPTGPLYGLRMTRLTDAAGEIENPILDRRNLTEDHLRRIKNFGARGGRRPLRFLPKDVSIRGDKDAYGDFLELAFTLDSGCYATILLREITKTDIA
ncbi:MAG: tRNA pseudouridine(13) synthase TruD [Planctomycetes bacterium]|nr:tRNA pseudouridine(13) synthase TruD [Planctomycetota bacterium]